MLIKLTNSVLFCGVTVFIKQCEIVLQEYVWAAQDISDSSMSPAGHVFGTLVLAGA
jgi:hypothetical protein